jgi:hypothetical protein
MARAVTQTFQEPQCTSCKLRMRLAALTRHPYDQARLPIARFDCECGQTITMRWYPVVDRAAARPAGVQRHATPYGVH